MCLAEWVLGNWAATLRAALLMTIGAVLLISAASLAGAVQTATLAGAVTLGSYAVRRARRQRPA